MSEWGFAYIYIEMTTTQNNRYAMIIALTLKDNTSFKHCYSSFTHFNVYFSEYFLEMLRSLRFLDFLFEGPKWAAK